MLIDNTKSSREYRLLIPGTINYLKKSQKLVDINVTSSGLYVTKMLLDGTQTTYKLNIVIMRHYNKLLELF